MRILSMFLPFLTKSVRSKQQQIIGVRTKFLLIFFASGLFLRPVIISFSICLVLFVLIDDSSWFVVQLNQFLGIRYLANLF